MDTNVAPITYDKIIDRVEPEFNQIAPAGMNFKAERGFAMQHLMNNEYLMTVAQGNPVSLAQAIRNVAAIGLSLNPAKKQAYLIPRNVKVGGQYVSKVFFEPSYMGMCDLATGIGTIEWIQARVVYSIDTFVDNGPGLLPTHKYDAFAKTSDRGQFVGVYCVAKTKGGDFLTTTMNAEQILVVRDKSESYKKYKSGIWVDHFEEQAKKTVVRNAFKMWPKGEHMERLEQAVHMSNENEGFEPILTEPNIGEYTADQKAYFDKLIETSDAMGMMVLQQTIEERTFTNLYHSFVKGMKGKYQQIVDSLLSAGSNRLMDCVQAIKDGLDANDDAAVFEVVEDMNNDLLGIIYSRLNAAQVQATQKIKEQA